MLQAFLNIFRISELRNKIFFTLGMLCIYRIGFFIPLPGVSQELMKAWAEQQSGGATGNILDYVSIFTGGSLKQSTIFGLGIMPYISAAIIFQLLGTVSEKLKALQKEGPAGRQKVQEYTRYATVCLCLVQSIVYLKFFQSGESPVVYPLYKDTFLFWSCGVVALTSGTVFLMWLGEQIDKYGIGNGISLIITAGIIAGMPNAVKMVYSGFELNSSDAQYSPMTVIFLVLAFVVVVAGSIVITQGQRRIPIQQAKHTRGRRVYGGQRSYLPLRVNHGGVMPIIFASSLMIIPSMLLGYLESSFQQLPGEDTSGFYNVMYGTVTFLSRNFGFNGYLYTVAYIGLIYFFAYFWTTVQFQPKEMATQLRDHGSFIPGLRPGPRTADYLETVMERITYVGAGFLALIAVVPTIISGVFEIDFLVTQFLGGTGLLIVVSVMLDFVQRIEASLLMRNYQGFLASSGGKGPKIRGSRGGA
jgi:preprotein translocase subunit SecY